MSIAFARTARAPLAEIPVLEPQLTPKELIARATAMRERLREEQTENDERDGYGEDLFRAFDAADFCRITQPRMFGGYKFGMRTFYKTMVEVSRGHPAVGWCLTLAASHAFIGSRFAHGHGVVPEQRGRHHRPRLRRAPARHLRAACHRREPPGRRGPLGSRGREACRAQRATMLLTPESMLTIYPHTYSRRLRYDGLRDLVPVGGLCAYPFAFAAASQHPARD